MLSILVCMIISLTFIKIPNNYIFHKFQKTQYHKICWFIQKSESGFFKQNHYKAIFLGSSQCYYGINDSILGKGYLNLGMNTPSRDLDLYIKERFYETGGNAKNCIVVIGGGKIVSYGLHPLMPYLVGPNWLIKNGQSVLSVHFWKYLTNRFQVVFDYFSWLFLRVHEDLIMFKQEFGVGYLDKVTKRRQQNFEEISKLANEPYLEKSKVNFKEDILHNQKSQWNFFINNELKGSNKYLIIPGFQSLSSLEFEVDKINSIQPRMDWIPINYKNLGDLVNDSMNWADQGHLNRQGAMQFTNSLELINFR